MLLPLMSKKEFTWRYVLFFIAITFGAFGVVLMTRASLGINSIACLSYVISVYFPISMGSFTIFWYSLMMLLQLIIMSKAERRANLFLVLLQIPALVMFGLMVDGFMFLSQEWHLEQNNYFVCLAVFVVSTIFLALCIALQAIANVTQLSGDAFVILLAKKIKRKIGNVKLVYDLLLACSAIAVSLWATNFTEITGVREGSILGAFLVGPFVQLFLPRLLFIENFIKQKCN